MGQVQDDDYRLVAAGPKVRELSLKPFTRRAEGAERVLDGGRPVRPGVDPPLVLGKGAEVAEGALHYPGEIAALAAQLLPVVERLRHDAHAQESGPQVLRTDHAQSPGLDGLGRLPHSRQQTLDPGGV